MIEKRYTVDRFHLIPPSTDRLHPLHLPGRAALLPEGLVDLPQTDEGDNRVRGRHGEIQAVSAGKESEPVRYRQDDVAHRDSNQHREQAKAVNTRFRVPGLGSCGSGQWLPGLLIVSFTPSSSESNGGFVFIALLLSKRAMLVCLSPIPAVKLKPETVTSEVKFLPILSQSQP